MHRIHFILLVLTLAKAAQAELVLVGPCGLLATFTLVFLPFNVNILPVPITAPLLLPGDAGLAPEPIVVLPSTFPEAAGRLDLQRDTILGISAKHNVSAFIVQGAFGKPLTSP